MFKLLGNKKLFVLLAGMVIFLAIMGLTYSNQQSVTENATWPEKMLKDTVSWVQELWYRPAAAVAGFFEDMRNLTHVYEENRVLRRTLASYARDRAKLNTLELENERLMEALRFTEQQKQRNNYRYHLAHVVAVNPDPYNHTIRINLGSENGIKLNWAVTTTEGFLGRIVAVEPFYSTVQLITNTDERNQSSKAISATVIGKEKVSFGVVESYDMESGMLLMTKIEQDDPLEEHDIVITSGLGQVFPEGIVIGEIISREVGEFGITHTARIKPAATFSRLREVFVIEVPGM